MNAQPLLRLPPKGVCLNAAKQVTCSWPRCACRVDLVYKAGTNLPRPGRK